MSPTHYQRFDVYRTFMAMKQHFSNPKFDFFRYDGKVKVKESTYKSRNDYYFFESLARKLTPVEIRQYLLSNFVYSDNPSKVWIGDVKRSGKENWLKWQKVSEAMFYHFSEDVNKISNYMEVRDITFEELFICDSSHPPLLRLYIRKDIRLETLILLDMVLGYVLPWDKRLDDPLWDSLSLKIKKVKPFLSVPVKQYKQFLIEEFVK